MAKGDNLVLFALIKGVLFGYDTSSLDVVCSFLPSLIHLQVELDSLKGCTAPWRLLEARGSTRGSAPAITWPPKTTQIHNPDKKVLIQASG